MGKRREDQVVVDDVASTMSSSHKKKHKKHKHKKHKKSKIEPDSRDIQSPVNVSSSMIAGVVKLEKPPAPCRKSKKGRRDSGTSSDEERWLDAIESGKLEEVDDELMKMKPKDPKLMTARQRAMLRTDSGPSGEEALMALPSGYKEKVMTAEMVQKAALKSQRRKQQADEKREKDKKKTMDRILKKQESKASKISSQKGRGSKKHIPHITYHISACMNTISLPPDVQFPLQAVLKKEIPSIVFCGVDGCTNRKRYSCSQTGVPLCSLACYRKNLSGTEFAIDVGTHLYSYYHSN